MRPYAVHQAPFRCDTFTDTNIQLTKQCPREACYPLCNLLDQPRRHSRPDQNMQAMSYQNVSSEWCPEWHIFWATCIEAGYGTYFT